MAKTQTKGKTKSGTARKKSRSAAGKRTTSAKRSSASHGKSTAAVRKSAKAAQAAASSASHRQVGAIVLFAVSIFLLFVMLIPGGNVWAALRSIVFGLFGIGAFIWPFILIYVAIMTSLEKDKLNLRTKIIEASVLVILFCSAVHVFLYSGAVQSYGEDIRNAYVLGNNSHNGGAMGAIVGGALLVLFGNKVPAAITIILIMFVLLLLISGTTLTNFFKSLVKPVKKVSDATSEHFEERSRENEERRQLNEQRRREKEFGLKNERSKFDPDVDLGPAPGKKKPIGDEITDAEVALTNHGRGKAEKSKKGSSRADNIYAFNGNSDFGIPESAEDSKKPKTAKAKKAEEPEEKAAETQTPMPEVRLDDIIKKAAQPKSVPEAEKAEPAAAAAAAAATAAAAANALSKENKETSGAEYRLPPYDCLKPPAVSLGGTSAEELRENAEKLVGVLQSFGVKTSLVDISRGPSVTRYELAPAAGVKISKITGLSDDIALNLAASGVRIEAPIPNKAAVGIEVPTKKRETVTLREILESKKYKDNVKKSKLNVALGRDIAGNVCMTDIAKMPHLLVAGTTGSGKSVCLNSMILSILYNATPDEVKLVMIDPKKVEFSVYNGIPHLLIPVVSDPHKASGALAWAVKEMLNRYKTFSENNVRDIRGYNEMAEMDADKAKMPEIVIFIDELADLMMAAPTEVEDSICRLAQMARAAGMHLIIATQRPSVDVITGLIKANIPSRLSLSVSSAVDSRTILDMGGAEKLLGNGDMLFNPVGNSKPTRIQGCFTSDKEVEDVVEYIKAEVTTEYNEEVLKEIEKEAAASENNNKKNGVNGPAGAGADDDADQLLPDAIQVVVEAGQASTTLIQRKLKVGYARAARIIDELEERGIIGAFEGSKPRKVLITKNQWLEMNAMSPDEDDGTVAAIDLGVEEK